MNIVEIQKYLKEHGFDGWLMADFHGRNSVAVEMIGLSGIVTRRSFYFIPSEGEPTGLVSPIEMAKFKHLPGNVRSYFGYKELEKELAALLKDCKRLAMEYSKNGRLPYVGLVDAGTIELIKGFGVEVVSSADLVAGFQARLSKDQMESHRLAARNLIEIKSRAHDFIAEALKSGKAVTEYNVQQFIVDQFDKHDMMTAYPPNCSVDAHAGDPHYEPDAENSATSEKGQLVLIDLWAKPKAPGGIDGDITWMAYAGTADEIPARYKELFDVIVRARDAAVQYINDNAPKGPVFGADVDDACRAVVEKAGYGKYFTHRTGHSITTNEHGSGPNIDNLETEDHRQLQPGHLFSIEPGVYFEDCGFRTEIDVLMTEGGCEVASLPLQYDIVPLM